MIFITTLIFCGSLHANDCSQCQECEQSGTYTDCTVLCNECDGAVAPVEESEKTSNQNYYDQKAAKKRAMNRAAKENKTTVVTESN
jgi:uncharacterized Zn ribbon protein